MLGVKRKDTSELEIIRDETINISGRRRKETN